MPRTPTNKELDKVLRQIKRSRRNRKLQLNDLPPELRGFSQNRFGGHQTSRMKALKSAGYDKHDPGTVLEGEKKQAVIEDLKRRGDSD